MHIFKRTLEITSLLWIILTSFYQDITCQDTIININFPGIMILDESTAVNEDITSAVPIESSVTDSPFSQQETTSFSLVTDGETLTQANLLTALMSTVEPSEVTELEQTTDSLTSDDMTLVTSAATMTSNNTTPADNFTLQSTVIVSNITAVERDTTMTFKDHTTVDNVITSRELVTAEDTMTLNNFTSFVSYIPSRHGLTTVEAVIATNDTTIAHDATSQSIITSHDLSTDKRDTSPSIMPSNGLSTVHSVTKDPVLVVIPGMPETGVSCDRNTQKGCNITNLERCILIRERSARCVCLTGYARDIDSKTCIAVEQYMVTLKTIEMFEDDLNNPTSERYRELEFDARDTLIKSLQNSNLWAITKDVTVLGFRRSDDGTVLVDYKMDVSREYAPSEAMVKEALLEGIIDTLIMGDNKIKLSEVLVRMTTVTAPNPCSDPLLNHCDITSTCQRARRGFVCRCQQGDTDLSYNILEAPGEICSTVSCSCENGGICLKDSTGVHCSCPEWFLGDRCDINGRAIFITLACLLGFLFTLGVLLCTYCHAVGRVGRRKKFYRKSPILIEDIKPRRQNILYYINYPYNNYMSDPQLINYWQRPTNTLYSPRYPSSESIPNAITWKWVETDKR